MDFEVEYHKKKVKGYREYVLGADVGGTNTNIGVSGVKKGKPKLLFSMHFKSKDMRSLLPAMQVALDYAKKEHKIKIKKACVAAAGVVSIKRDYCKLTNAKLEVDAKRLLKKTELKGVYLVNDFEAIAYSLQAIPMRDLKRVRHVRVPKEGTKAAIGPGTGLGRCALVYDRKLDGFATVASEGYVDFPAYDKFEQDLVKFVKRKIKREVMYDDILSGRGLENIYDFLRKKKKFKISKFHKDINKSKEKTYLISKYRNKDPVCKETFRLFSKFLGRCAKNYALSTMARGGVYLAGGILANNHDAFNKRDFLKEFQLSKIESKILKAIPVYIITNYNVSLIGACMAAVEKL